MDKKMYCSVNDRIETVRFGKRYGYWWKQHKIIASRISIYYGSVDYFYKLEFTLDKPMTNKHFNRWLRPKNKRSVHE